MNNTEKTIPVHERTVCPSHPGEILKDLFLDDLEISITTFSDAIDVSRKTISAIINQHKRVTPEMALRFSKALKTSVDLWLNLQKNYDVWVITHSKELQEKTLSHVAVLV
ncbi:HigA family addiction module antitoxin [Lentisphaerota bacterium WC36G]|nr:HigA family addiction module antidote protein [Lentisphaerae bacterium WC36]